MIDVEIYRSIKDPNKFVGYILLPRDGKELTIRFDGPDEQTIRNKAQRFWEKHGTKSDDTSESSSGSGRGKSFAGKMWLYNKTTKERARVSDDEVESYLAKGFIRAGPRTT